MQQRRQHPTMRMAVAAIVLGAAMTGAAADPAGAKKANNEGMRWYKDGDYEKAIAAFERAIAEEPALVKAHYNRASMAALLGNWDVVTEELAWLRASKDAEATRVLAKSKTDGDFAAARMIDEGRVAMGLRTLDATPLADLLLEAGGKWSGVDEGTMEGFLEYTFAPKGKVRTRSHDGESGRWFVVPMTWKVVDGAVVLTAKQQKETWRLQPCESRNETGGMCLVEQDSSRWLAR